MLEEWLSIAEHEGYVKPTVYQGQYNLLCRGFEETLFPLLRKHHMSFAAFSPLAGGFLLGNFTEQGVQAGMRFSIASPFTTWYDTPSMHAAVKSFKDIARDSGIELDELAVRWIAYHSALRDEDAVILGGTKVEQITNNAQKIKKGPLSETVAQRLDDLWGTVKEDGVKITTFAES
jgi:aflatoxin B1 aldehyde reductase